MHPRQAPARRGFFVSDPELRTPPGRLPNAFRETLWQTKRKEDDMAERHRSKDGSRDTEQIIGEAAEISQQGRDGGDLERRVGTRDEQKRATERPAGSTRVTGADRRATGTAPDGEGA